MSQPPTTAIPSPYQLRAELEAMVLGDLLGPAEGPNEELTERTVRDRYLVGVLAPSRSGERRAASGADPSRHPSPVTHDDLEDDDLPRIPDELSEGGSDTADDGTTDADVPVAVAYLPSSFGMSFCVDAEAESIEVDARWGQYRRETRQEQISPRTGHPLR
ncbi:MAG: hypothetical protein KDA69_11125, partial [Planctomycetaceae bacterium]|nr:hypothetical protein [Planctomycetaceae bacterium]